MRGKIPHRGKQGPGARERNQRPVSRIFLCLRHEMRAQALQLSSDLRVSNEGAAPKTKLPFRIGTSTCLCGSCELSLPAEMGTILACLGMPGPRLMCGVEVQSKQPEFEAAAGCF